ncbi:hypothetical protein Acor_43100 [Acrocarpospora corrugata]|uniref:Uncharacterized protein n=1 Tax=Acrocarpospora corrugata TaxID=35763 RepID=A0A5M3VZJ1_9ACTN|nr:hypothetical protein Acor_43100 [Acrocarpospora corrugata]
MIRPAKKSESVGAARQSESARPTRRSGLTEQGGGTAASLDVGAAAGGVGSGGVGRAGAFSNLGDPVEPTMIRESVRVDGLGRTNVDRLAVAIGLAG